MNNIINKWINEYNIITYNDIIKYINKCSKKMTPLKRAIKKYQQSEKYKTYKRTYYLKKKQLKIIKNN